jgi:hypothetical protein
MVFAQEAARLVEIHGRNSNFGVAATLRSRCASR